MVSPSYLRTGEKIDLEPAIDQLKENGLKIAANNDFSTGETFMSWKKSNGGLPQLSRDGRTPPMRKDWDNWTVQPGREGSGESYQCVLIHERRVQKRQRQTLFSGVQC